MNKLKNKFNFFVPVNDIEKSVDTSGNETYRVKGLISDSSWDSDGESLDYNGFDFSEFQYINWDHKKEPKYIIGEPEKWKTLPGKGVFMEGVIFPESEVGRQAIDLMKVLKASKRGNKLGWSVEGHVLERDLLNPKKVKKAKITAVALCPMPKNGNTFAELVQKGFSGDDIYKSKEDLEFEDANGGEEVELSVDLSNGNRIIVDKEGNISTVEKAQDTSNSRALIKEDVEGNEKDSQELLKKAIVDIATAHQEGTEIPKEVLEKAIKAKNFLKVD